MRYHGMSRLGGTLFAASDPGPHSAYSCGEKDKLKPRQSLAKRAGVLVLS
jgi:hypothetical protein